ncbi:MAG TPA: hypothetical protein VE198_16230 [Actinoallomurus sp.]|nr:hypothetical protein [Actinoallomurus sp.]
MNQARLRSPDERAVVDDSHVVDRSRTDPEAFAELFQRHSGEIGR